MATVGKTPRIPQVLLRRINRVRSRYAPTGDTEEEMFDDFFVLWRAYESTCRMVGRSRQQSFEATVEAIDYAGFVNLKSLQEWARALRHFREANIATLSEWFSTESLTAVKAREYQERIARVAEAAQAPDRWHRRDSESLARILYDIRCAVMHSSLETGNALALRILDPLRLALVELVVARAARGKGIPFSDAQAEFDSHLEAQQ